MSRNQGKSEDSVPSHSSDSNLRQWPTVASTSTGPSPRTLFLMNKAHKDRYPAMKSTPLLESRTLIWSLKTLCPPGRYFKSCLYGSDTQPANVEQLGKDCSCITPGHPSKNLSHPEIKFHFLGGKWKGFLYLSFPLVMLRASHCGRLDQNLPKGCIDKGRCLKGPESRPHCSGFCFLSAPLREACLQTGDVRRPHTQASPAWKRRSN